MSVPTAVLLARLAHQLQTVAILLRAERTGDALTAVEAAQEQISDIQESVK